MKHSTLMIKLANKLMDFTSGDSRPHRLSLDPCQEAVTDKTHVLVLLTKPTEGKDGEREEFSAISEILLFLSA